MPGLPNSIPAARDTSARWLIVTGLAIFSLAFWFLTRSWHAALLDHFEFRQLQTALSIFWLKQEGFRLDYPTPLFGPPWSIPFEFPLYQGSVALLSQLTGMAIEPAGRWVGVAFYAATFPAIYGLAGIAGLAPSRRLLVLAVVAITPIYLFYPRTVMIETTALCFAVWFVYALYRALSSHSWAWFIAATFFALFAALTKITTFVVYCTPAGLLTAAVVWQTRRRDPSTAPGPIFRLLAWSAIPVALGMGAALWWIAFSDAIKLSNPLTQYLTSQSLRNWNYDTGTLRFGAEFWLRLWKNITQGILGEGAMALVLVGATFATSLARRIALVGLAGFITGPLIFANLYHVHDYYFSANALLLSGAAGVLLASAWDNARLRPGSRWALLLLFLLLQYRSFDAGYRRYYQQQAAIPDLATIVRATVPAEDVIVVAGADWLPLLPYYSQRKAIMLTEGRNLNNEPLNALLRELPPRRPAALAVVGEWRLYKEWIRERTAYLGLAPQPFASSADTDLYLPREAIRRSVSLLGNKSFAGVKVRISDTMLPMAVSQEQQLSARDFTMCVPAPHRSRSQFGITTGTIENQPVIFTHAPSELYFTPPPGTHRLAATLGLIAEAYAHPLPQASDGIVVEIFEQQPDGLRHSLLRRELNPVSRKEDRGPQEINYENEVPFMGELVFVIAPGAADNAAYDQTYWSRIEIR